MSKKNRGNSFINERKLAPIAQAAKPRFDKAEKEKRPWFSYRYMCDGQFCMKRCSIEQFKGITDKLRMLSALEWKQIESSPRETAGYELIPTRQIRGSIPDAFSTEDRLMVFRFGGSTGARAGRIAGVRDEERFHILFIDRNFTLYDHS